MSTDPPLILTLLWIAWATQAVLSTHVVWFFSLRVRGRSRPVPDHDHPHAAVIMPVKGRDEYLQQTVEMLCRQDYDDYRVVIVVESQDDPAYAVVRDTLARFVDRRSDLLVSGTPVADEGPKTHNQICAMDHLLPDADDRDVWVFADSDAVPDNTWLTRMISPLCRKGRYGVTTGYRWLIPQDGDTANFWTQMASVINSSVACMFGQTWRNHAWGGSMALRVELARRGDLRNRFVGVLCEDYVLDRMARELGEKVRFVPQGLIASQARFTRRSLFEFAHRQYLFTRVYRPGLYWTALGLMLLYMAGFVSAWSYLAWVVLTQQPAIMIGFPAVMVLSVLVANHLRAWRRRCAIRHVFDEPVLDQLRAAMRWDRWGTVVWMTLHLLLVLRALCGRRLTWRGTRYRIPAPNRTQRLEG